LNRSKYGLLRHSRKQQLLNIVAATSNEIGEDKEHQGEQNEKKNDVQRSKRWWKKIYKETRKARLWLLDTPLPFQRRGVGAAEALALVPPAAAEEARSDLKLPPRGVGG
jgi:hypothetical protein